MSAEDDAHRLSAAAGMIQVAGFQAGYGNIAVAEMAAGQALAAVESLARHGSEAAAASLQKVMDACCLIGVGEGALRFSKVLLAAEEQ